ncbi:hypothetical protein SAMN05216233_11952 [Desulfoluna spongiiphila]|uniref:Uncharacterized protein n=1 Tax=Desulfoluna spongiiphila TaxID=419481 RepID=A0A1G5IDE4_9BACT|nr:hypothetical protein SAMN05216233_11952 [Desulfoluna spongiiphila]
MDMPTAVMDVTRAASISAYLKGPACFSPLIHEARINNSHVLHFPCVIGLAVCRHTEAFFLGISPL